MCKMCKMNHEMKKKQKKKLCLRINVNEAKLLYFINSSEFYQTQKNCLNQNFEKKIVQEISLEW